MLDHLISPANHDCVCPCSRASIAGDSGKRTHDAQPPSQRCELFAPQPASLIESTVATGRGRGQQFNSLLVEMKAELRPISQEPRKTQTLFLVARLSSPSASGHTKRQGKLKLSCNQCRGAACRLHCSVITPANAGLPLGGINSTPRTPLQNLWAKSGD